MKLIKFLNRHVFISIILYFALMVGVAWAVSEHIAARTQMTDPPADDDVLAIYDTNAGTGLGIEVSVFRGDNLNAIVNAETGVTDPAITMYDSSPGAGTADIFGTSTGAYDIIMSLWVDVAGTPTEYLQIDGVSETVDVLKPLTAPGISGGRPYLYDANDYDMTAITNCQMDVYLNGVATQTVTLHGTPSCDTNYSKEICVYVYEEINEKRVDVQSDDVIVHNSTIFTAGYYIKNTSKNYGDFICLRGSGTTYWNVWSYTGTWVTQ